MKSTSGLKNVLLLLIVMAIAIFFRLYRLDSVPPGLYPDVAMNGNNALQSLQIRNYKTFYSDNNGREGMIMWLDAASMIVFGVKPIALEIPAAIFGTLTVFGIYLLARELIDRRKNAIALLSAFLLATSFWHINFSRIGFRVILEPFFLVFVFYFLAKAMRGRKFLWAILAGIFFGLGFYTYTGYRMAVPLLFCVLALWLIPFWKDKQQFIKISLATLSATFVIALPIGIYFLRNPTDFLGRADQTSVFSSPHPLLELGKSLVLHLGMFDIYGDANWRHNLPGWPELFLPVGLLFLFGICLATAQIIKSAKTKNWGPEFQSYSLLILWFFFMLLPGVLTSEGIPHALRTLGVIPAVMILSAIGGIAAWDWTKSRWPKIATSGILALFIVTVLGQGYWQYFVAWAGNPNIQSAFTANFVALGNLSAQFHDQGWQTIVVVNENGTPVPYPNGLPMPAQTVKFTEAADCYRHGGSTSNCGPYSTYLNPDQIANIAINSKTAIFPMKDDQSIFNQLSLMFPQGLIKQQNNIKYYEINK
jgi:4-amino-4-deoxy-L-arabinose transferase-like glycosyltransferase